jgi:hypothetical protein
LKWVLKPLVYYKSIVLILKVFSEKINKII